MKFDAGPDPEEVCPEEDAIRILREQKAEIAKLTADNEAYCQRDMQRDAELLDYKQQVERLTRELEGVRKPLTAECLEDCLSGCNSQYGNETVAEYNHRVATHLVHRLQAQAPTQPAPATVTTELEKVQRWHLTQTKPGIFRHCYGMWIDRDCAIHAAKEDQAAAVKAAEEPLRKRIAELESETVSDLVVRARMETAEARKRIGELEKWLRDT